LVEAIPAKREDVQRVKTAETKIILVDGPMLERATTESVAA
jgi:hypothetical protein